MDNFYYTPTKCPKHPKENLDWKNLLIKTPNDPVGTVYPIEGYCKKENKFADGKNLITVEECALIIANNMENKNYKLEDIKVEEISKLVRKIKN